MPGLLDKAVGDVSAAAADTDGGGVQADIAAQANRQTVVSSIDMSSDSGALVTVESPAGTVLWRKRYAAAFADGKVFPPGALKGVVNQVTRVKISAATANSEVQISGFTVVA